MVAAIDAGELGALLAIAVVFAALGCATVRELWIERRRKRAAERRLERRVEAARRLEADTVDFGWVDPTREGGQQ